MIKYVLFDLDGTLLPMDQDLFVNTYFKKLAEKMAPLGYDPKELINSVWTGTKAMVMNDGSCSNEKRFWDKFVDIYGEKARDDEAVFEEFYKNDFVAAKAVCGKLDGIQELIDAIKAKGIGVALATNPIFPDIATAQRIEWAGLRREDFDLVTTYENSCHGKPNVEYFRDVARELGVEPDECLMVGNDVTEDMVASTIGMEVFLLTDWIINKEDEDITKYPHGDYNALKEYIYKNII